jgi:hypothetical protein
LQHVLQIRIRQVYIVFGHPITDLAKIRRMWVRLAPARSKLVARVWRA